MRRIPLRAVGRRESVEDGAFVFALVDPLHSKPVEDPIPLRGERLAQPCLLRACRAITTHVQHQVALFAELGQVADFLRLRAECVPPCAREFPPQLAVAVGRLVQLVQVSKETGNSRDVQHAAHDLRPFLERPEACFV